jgi:hypothetical protein
LIWPVEINLKNFSPRPSPDLTGWGIGVFLINN